jgi:hypothetical protein
MSERPLNLCPDDLVSAVLAILQHDDEAGLQQIAQHLLQYPADPRLHFLAGSVFAGLQRYEEGRRSMQNAIDIAPGYELARFQLGFLELTSGFPEQAATTWAPFEKLPADAPFRLLSSGLNCLAADDFAECTRLLGAGMQANNEHPLINGDMQLILDEIADKTQPDGAQAEPAAEAASATHMLLQQFELKDSANKTKH